MMEAARTTYNKTDKLATKSRPETLNLQATREIRYDAKILTNHKFDLNV